MSFIKSLQTVLSHPLNRGKEGQTLARVMWWKLNQLFFHIPALVDIAPGVRIICDPMSSYGSFVVYARWPEYAELNFVNQFLQTRGVYVDVGAHIGDSSLLAAARVGAKGRVLACEPTPSTYQELLTNIHLNRFETIITPINKAISNRKGTAHFVLESASEVNHLHTKKVPGKTISTKVVTIDSLFKEYSLRKIDVLKIDVEGFEWEVLQGSKNSLKQQKIDVILFELNPRSLNIAQKTKQIQQLLEQHRFTFFEFTEKGKIYSVETLVVPPQTSNILAVSSRRSISAKLNKWRQSH